jgi:hypothetical protein
MKKKIWIFVLVCLLAVLTTACAKNINYYLRFDEGLVQVDKEFLELEIDGEVVSMLERNPDWDSGKTIGFETNAHKKPAYIKYIGYGCVVEYYDYPNKKSLTYEDTYYVGEDGDWDGMGTFVKEETHYYENGQIEKHIVREIDKSDEENQIVFVSIEEYFDQDGNHIAAQE